MPRYEMLRGYSLARHKRREEAQACFKRAIADAHALRDTETETDAWLWLGTSQLTPDQFDADEIVLLHAQELAEAGGLEYQKAEALNNRGYIQLKRQRYAAAIPLLEAARDAANRAGAGFMGTLALNNLALCYENLGDLDRALDAQRESVKQQEKYGLETLLSNGYSELGSILNRKGQTEEAIPYFLRAFHAVSKDAPVQYSLSAGNLANLYQQTGLLDKAEETNRIAFQFADQKDKPHLASLTATEAAIAERRGNHDQAISSYQKALVLASDAPAVLWQTYAGLAGVYGVEGDFHNADASYSKAISVITTNRADQLKSDYKITFLNNLIHFYQDYVALLMQHGESERALEIADSSRASVLTEDLTGKNEPSSIHSHRSTSQGRSG